MKKITLLSLIIFMFGLNIASAHFTGNNSVDGDEIRWGGSTTYSSAWSSAVSTWNGLDSIDILPDTWYVIEDLTIADVAWSGSVWYASYNPEEDYIYFNTTYIDGDGLSSSQKHNVAAHELGHALGLGHHTISDNIMDYTDFYTSIGDHDEADYDTLWN